MSLITDPNAMEMQVNADKENELMRIHKLLLALVEKDAEIERLRAALEDQHTATDQIWNQYHALERDNATLTARLGRVKNGLRTLLKSRDCLTLDGYAEIPEELSAQFDIGLDDARQVVDALAAPVDAGGREMTK